MKILSVFGTRPEAIKMAPVVKQLEQHGGLDSKVCVTGQHKEMLDHVLQLFEIQPDFNLQVMQAASSLSELVAAILSRLDAVLVDYQPDMLLVHGDTSTTMAATLAAFHRRIPVGHVEAGLRTGNLDAPWPEEGNRRIVGALARVHFAPTAHAAANLRAENIPEDRILITGNTVIDALLMTRDRSRADAALGPAMRLRYPFLQAGRPLVLITAHRRESFGAGFERICAALQELAQRHPDTDFVYPVHLNPNVSGPVRERLGQLDNMHLIEPQEYAPFVWLMDQSTVILTDSGGIQEEAPSLGKPVLVMRDNTERPEAVAAGTVTLVGTDVARIVEATSAHLRAAPATAKIIDNPYGDGRAAARIVDYLAQLA